MQKKCGYKDINNQIELIECDKVQLSNYICQKKIEKRVTEYGRGKFIEFNKKCQAYLSFLNLI